MQSVDRDFSAIASPALKNAFGFDGQVAVVTGATSGIGRACALAFGAAGCKVVVNHLPRAEAAADEVASEIEASGSQAITLPADVSIEAEVDGMFAATVRHFGTVHILVSNAGIQSGAPLSDMTFEQWRRVLAVNLDGQFLCARAAARE